MPDPVSSATQFYVVLSANEDAVLVPAHADEARVSSAVSHLRRTEDVVLQTWLTTAPGAEPVLGASKVLRKFPRVS